MKTSEISTVINTVKVTLCYYKNKSKNDLFLVTI